MKASEVKRKMENNNEQNLDALERLRQKKDEAKVKGVTGETVTETKEPATQSESENSPIAKLKDAAKANSGAQAEDEQEVKTTSEFDKSEKQEDTDVRVTADTEGVLNYVEYPISVNNEMPAENGVCASNPIATWEKKRAIGNSNIVYGRFLANVDGKAVEEVHTQKTEVRAELLVPQQKKLKEVQNKLLESIKSLSEPNMDSLREYMTEHCRYCSPVTDKDNKTAIKVTIRKDKDGITTTGYKVGETGCGTIKYHIINVPQRAYDALNTSSYSDTNLTREIVSEKDPAIIQIIIKHSDFTSFLGSKTDDGIYVLETLSDKVSANKVISDNPAIGVREMIKAVYKGKPYKAKVSSDMTVEQIAKRNETKTNFDKKLSELTANRGEVTAIFSLEYKAKSNVRTRLVSPINYIPMKTQNTITAGASFREREGASAADLTRIYMTEPVKKIASANASFDSVLGTVKEPTDKDKFYFVPEIKPNGVGENPIFYKTGKNVIVEPYFTTLVREEKTYKAKKIPKELHEVIKKVPNAKKTGYQVEFSSISSDTGYDRSYYDNVVANMRKGSNANTHILTIEELRQTFAKTKSSPSTTTRATANLDSLIKPFERVMLMMQDSEVLTQFEEVSETIKATKSDPKSKITGWSHVNAANKKAVISRSALQE